MKKFTAVLISCSLAFAAAAMAQQPDEEQQAQQKKKQSEKGHPAKETAPGKQEAAKKEHAEAKGPAAAKTAKETNAPVEAKAKPQASASASMETEAKAKPAGSNPKAAAEQRKNQQSPASTTANKPANPTPAAAAQSPAAAQPAAGAGAAQANKQTGVAAKKPDAQAVQTIKAQHVNFHAQPQPQKVPTVTFNQSYRINGADQWQGENYTVFRSYRPEMHDQGWYRSRYSRVELIGGGYYYLNNGYWYPAWGYNPSNQYYAYDGPIYVGHRAEPPDQVIADVQASLQQQGYYRGEVDGLLGPLTREALSAYQSDNGLYTTSAIDQPTLDSLGMG